MNFLHHVYVFDHKPVLAMTATSVGVPILRAAMQAPQEHVMTAMEIFDQWIHVIGGVVGILAGVASVSWYLYSFIKARRAEGDD